MLQATLHTICEICHPILLFGTILLLNLCDLPPYTLIWHYMFIRHTRVGITISNDLNWSTHIITITNKCNSKLGFLRRNLSRCPQKLKETAYISLVRPTLEYAASVWDPHLIKDRNSLEAVQRKAARFVYGVTGGGLALHIC